MKSEIDQCIKCSICTAYCPVAGATGLFPGPKLSGPDAERFRRRNRSIPPEWLQFCDYCKICERVCPNNVPLSKIQLQSRLASGRRRKPSLRDWLLGHSYLMEKLGSWTAPVSNWVAGWGFCRWLLDRGLGLNREARIPAFRRQTFARWFRSRTPGAGEPIAYFYGCYTNYVDPDLGRDVVEVLEKNGFRPVLPRQECCALPLISNGFLDLAVRFGERNLNSLRKAVDDGMEIIFSSPSCGMTLGQEYESLLGLAGASFLAGHLFEISQFLLQLYEQGRMNTEFREIRETYYYHAPCHLRALQVGLPALDLLSLIPGLRVVELPEGCCGLAGTYGYKQEKHSVATEVGRELFQEIRRVKARAVISECEACRMQIGYHTGASTLHPVQILKRAYGG